MGRNGGADPSLMIVSKTKKALGLTHDGFKILVEPSGIEPLTSTLPVLWCNAVRDVRCNSRWNTIKSYTGNFLILKNHRLNYTRRHCNKRFTRLLSWEWLSVLVSIGISPEIAAERQNDQRRNQE